MIPSSARYVLAKSFTASASVNPMIRCINIFLNGTFLQKSGEAHAQPLLKSRIRRNPRSDDYPGRIQVVVQRPGLPQEFRAEYYTRRSGTFHAWTAVYPTGTVDLIIINRLRVAVYEPLRMTDSNRRCVKEVLLAVIVGRRSDQRRNPRRLYAASASRVAVRSSSFSARYFSMYSSLYWRLPPVDHISTFSGMMSTAVTG